MADMMYYIDMHAFLLITHNAESATHIDQLARKLKAKIIPFPLAKVEDTRNLNSHMRLSINEPTLVMVENIHKATTEALNAFLKNLEEPQENIFFALTAPSIRNVMPTIVSRCQIIQIKSGSNQIADTKVAEEFLEAGVGKKFLLTDKIKDRNTALEFVGDLIFTVHKQLHSLQTDHESDAKNLETLITTLNNLKANGNISLQLTNMVTNFSPSRVRPKSPFQSDKE
jgi:replication-associated recombination protein RarA